MTKMGIDVDSNILKYMLGRQGLRMLIAVNWLRSVPFEL
jgi:hypothetical protein